MQNLLQSGIVYLMEVLTMFQKKKTAPKGLNIIIVGCGKVGATLVEQLEQEGHDITLIDKNAEKILKNRVI